MKREEALREGSEVITTLEAEIEVLREARAESD